MVQCILSQWYTEHVINSILSVRHVQSIYSLLIELLTLYHTIFTLINVILHLIMWSTGGCRDNCEHHRENASTWQHTVTNKITRMSPIEQQKISPFILYSCAVTHYKDHVNNVCITVCAAVCHVIVYNEMQYCVMCNNNYYWLYCTSRGKLIAKTWAPLSTDHTCKPCRMHVMG